MGDVDLRMKTAAREPKPAPPQADVTAPASRLRAVPMLVTMIGVLLAGIAFWAMWEA